MTAPRCDGCAACVECACFADPQTDSEGRCIGCGGRTAATAARNGAPHPGPKVGPFEHIIEDLIAGLSSQRAA